MESSKISAPKRENARDARIDCLRALAILTVMVGHSIILYSSTWNIYHSIYTSHVLDCIKRVINLYQMPLFFSLSGFLFAKSPHIKPLGAFLWKKTRRLLIPFGMIGLFYMIPMKLLLHYPLYYGAGYIEAVRRLLVGKDTGHLWFLPSLFFMFLISCVVVALCKNTRRTWALITIIGLAATFLNQFVFRTSCEYISGLLSFYWSFSFGAVLFHAYSDKKPKAQTVVGVASGLTAIAATAFYLNTSLYQVGMIATIAILLMLYSVTASVKIPVIGVLSKYSFGLYLLHSPLIYITFTYFLNSHPLLTVALNFFVFGGIALLMTILLQKTRLKFILGQ